jgi:outer membrane protein assembly factor BamB
LQVRYIHGISSAHGHAGELAPRARHSRWRGLAERPCVEAAALSKGALVSLRTGKVLQRYSAVGGAVPDGRGGWFVVKGGIEIRRMRHDGSLGRGWHSRPTDRRPIANLLRVGGRLYVDDGYRVHAISSRTGRSLWTSQRAHERSRIGILAMAANAGVVYIGGYLTQVREARRERLAALDARTGRMLPWQAPLPGY